MICDKSVVITHSQPEGTAADKVMIDCLYFVPVNVSVCLCVCVCVCL